MGTWEIRSEESRDAAFIDLLVARSFGPGRYAKSAYRLREGVLPEEGLGLVAVEHHVLRGSVRFWPIAIGSGMALLLGPLAVETEQRGRGIGIALMQRGIEEARIRGHRAIILIGDAPYYARAGFSPLPTGRLRLPGPADPSRILGLELVASAFEGLKGDVRRARIDDPVCAPDASLVGRLAKGSARS